MHADANNINYCSATDGAKIKCKTHLIFFAQLFGETILQISGPTCKWRANIVGKKHFLSVSTLTLNHLIGLS